MTPHDVLLVPLRAAAPAAHAIVVEYSGRTVDARFFVDGVEQASATVRSDGPRLFWIGSER